MKRLALTAILWSALGEGAHAAPRQVPAALAAQVQEKIGAELPADLSFTTAQGEPLSLSDLRARNLPLLLVLTYARCTMLCSWVLQGVANAVALLPGDMTPGRDFLPIVVSIDPRESPAAAAAKQAVLLERLHLQGDPRRFPFLVSPEDRVRSLAASLGFSYAWDPRTEQYAHPAVIFVLTPQLRISRYLHGVQYPADVLARSLREAAAGHLAEQRSPPEDSALLRCFRFMTGSQRYASELQGYFRVAGALIVLAVAGLLAGLLRRERRRAP